MENLKEFWLELEAQMGVSTIAGTNEKAGGKDAAPIQRVFSEGQNYHQVALQSAIAKALINVHCALVHGKYVRRSYLGCMYKTGKSDVCRPICPIYSPPDCISRIVAFHHIVIQ